MARCSVPNEIGSDLLRRPPVKLSLDNGDVHVWRADLNIEPSEIESLFQALTADERMRAERLYFSKDRRCFIAARGLLRTILGLYLEIEPGKLEFFYSSNGKPGLLPNSGGNTLCFNASHSHGLALFAVTYGRKVGVDLERIASSPVNEEAAEQFFSPSEISMFLQLPPHEQKGAFFRCWTRKEAFAKAVGDGLSISFDQLEVPFAPGEPGELLNTKWNLPEKYSWSLYDLTPGPGYAGALAVEGENCNIKWRQCPEDVD